MLYSVRTGILSQTMSALVAGLAAASMLASGGCSGTSAVPVRTEVLPYTEEQAQAREQAADARYRLRVGDVISLSFKYEKDLNQPTVLVLPDGYITLTGIGTTVKAAGRTLEDLDADITGRYSAEYRNPDLGVAVVELSEPEVYVLGMVNKPGMYQLPVKGGGVVQAVAMAGGFTADAKQNEVAVLRAVEDGFMVRVIDCSHLEQIGLNDLSYFDLQPYDVVYVPRSSLGDFAYLTEAVFGSALNISQFFWDVYAISHLDKIDRIVR